MTMPPRLLLALALLPACAAPPAATPAPEPAPAPAPAGNVASALPLEPAIAGKRAASRGGVVVTSAADASAAGLAMLDQGGNAFDAAVAASFALGVVDPSQTGLGGYAVGIAWSAAERRAEVMEAMGQAGADSAWGLPDPPRGDSASRVSFDGGDARQPRTALVPGFVSGLLAWHAWRGKLPRAVVLAPAIRLAREGFVVGPLNHRLFTASRDKLLADPEAAALFMPGGEPLRVGDRLVQSKLADLLEAIARDGADAMYTGDVARRIAEKTRAVGGLLDATDFGAYEPEFRRPVCSAFHEYTVLGAPSPVAGPSMSELLNLAEHTGLSRMPDPTYDTASAVRLADVVRVSVADRRLLGGHPDWRIAPVRGVTNAGFAASRAPLVGRLPVADTLPPGNAWAFENQPLDPRCTPHVPYPAAMRPAGSADPTAREPQGGAASGDDTHSLTSHLVVIDAERNAVSLTSSVGVLFGSGVYAEGIFLNSSGNLFSRGDRAPGRKPGSALSPTLLLEGNEVRLAAGAGGAAYIPTAVGQVILRMAAWKQDPWTALAAPRLQPSAFGPALEIEQGFALPVYGALRAHGYRPYNRVATLQFAGVHAAWVGADGIVVGAADPRRDGVALGQAR